MYHVFEGDVFSWRGRTVHAELLNTPNPRPYWWDGKAIDVELPTLRFAVRAEIPVQPDIYFTGTEFLLVSQRLTTLLRQFPIPFETFAAELIDRKTQNPLTLNYSVIHLLENTSAIDTKRSKITSTGIKSLVFTDDAHQSGKLLFRAAEEESLVLIHDELLQVFKAQGITGGRYTPVGEFQF